MSEQNGDSPLRPFVIVLVEDGECTGVFGPFDEEEVGAFVNASVAHGADPDHLFVHRLDGPRTKTRWSMIYDDNLDHSKKV